MEDNELNVTQASKLLGVSRPTLYKLLHDGKLASLSYSDLREYLVRGTSPITSPAPTSLDTSHTPVSKEEVLVSSPPTPTWAKVKAPWEDKDLDEVDVSPSRKHWLDEAADQVEAAQASKKKKYFS